MLVQPLVLNIEDVTRFECHEFRFSMFLESHKKDIQLMLQNLLCVIIFEVKNTISTCFPWCVLPFQVLRSV